MVSDLLKNGVKIEAKPEEEQSFLMNIFVSWFPMLLLIGVWVFFMRQMQGGGKGGAFSFGKSARPDARRSTEHASPSPMSPVATRPRKKCQELVDFLRDPVQVPEARWSHSRGRADGRHPGYRQDAAGQGDRR